MAADAIINCSDRPARVTMSLKTNSAMGERQMLPWQMNNTFILIKAPFKMRCPAAICSDLRGVNSSLCIGHFCTKNAKLSKILQDVYSKSSRNGVKSGWGYYFISSDSNNSYLHFNLLSHTFVSSFSFLL